MNKFKALILGLGLITGMAFAADTHKAETGSAPLPDKVVVLSFDDAISSHYSVVAPILTNYGFGATFFICEFPPDFDKDKTKYLSWEQIAGLNKMGFEIANHTRTHADIGKLSNEQLTAELNYIDEKCKTHGIPKTVTFAYPGYGLNTNAFSVFQERGFLFARAGWNRCYDPTVDHPYLVPSFDISGTNDLKVIDFLKQAAPGKIVVLTIHGVPDLAHDWVNTPPELFKKYMRFLKDNRYTVIAMRDLARYVDAKKEIRLRSSLPVSWIPYRNTQYDFAFALPSDWQGYSVLSQQWEGQGRTPGKDELTVVEHGPQIVLRHPLWKANEPYQDIPILVFTREQWNASQSANGFSIGTGGYVMEIQHNARYVFGVHSRFNAADNVKGWKEAADAVERNRTANPHLDSK